jgi:hypothetical protein
LQATLLLSLLFNTLLLLVVALVALAVPTAALAVAVVVVSEQMLQAKHLVQILLPKQLLLLRFLQITL